MNVFCVNKSHKDFKKLSKELDIHEDQLNDIIYKYENDNQVDTFPSKEYIENQLRGDNPVTSQDQYGIWLNKYSEPKVFDSKEEANSYIEEAKRFFPAKEAIVIKRKVNGQIEVTIGKPYVVETNIASLLSRSFNSRINILTPKRFILAGREGYKFSEYLKKSRGVYPKTFKTWYNGQQVTLEKSNTNKRSRKYNVLGVNGEVIAEKLPLYTEEEYKTLQKRIAENRNKFKPYREGRSLQFKAFLSKPSKGLFKYAAKTWLSEALETSGIPIDYKIIDSFIEKFSDSFWENVVTYILNPRYNMGRSMKDGIFGEMTTLDPTFSGWVWNPTIPKQGLIEELEKRFNIKIDGKELFGVSINRALKYNDLKKSLIKYLRNKLHFTENQCIEAYAKIKDLTVEEAKKYIQQIKNEQFEDSSIGNSRILDEVRSAPLILAFEEIQDSYDKKFEDYLKQKGIKIPKGVANIIFNREIFAGEDTRVNRLATIFHEPFHALEILAGNTPQMQKIYTTLAALLSTKYGKELLDSIEKFNTVYKTEDLNSEILANIFSLIMLPEEYRKSFVNQNENNEFLGVHIAKKINELWSRPSTQKYLATTTTKEEKFVLNTVTTEEKEVLPLLKRIWNDLIDILKEYFHFVDESLKFAVKTKYITNNVVKLVPTEKITFVEKEKINEDLIQFKEALNSLTSLLQEISGIEVTEETKLRESSSFASASESLSKHKQYAEREAFNKQLGEENTRTDIEKALNNWFEWGKEHIKFDEASHIYYIDGKPVDFSVTVYYESIYGKPNIKGDYSHSSAIGKTMDNFYRDYFKGEDVLSKDYPNLNQKRKKEALVDVRRLESYLDKKFGVDNSGKKKYKVITTEFPLAARINTPIGEQTIAGTMDMLVIDSEGNLHIFDFKAKTNTIDQWNNRRNYTAQLNLYKALLESINPVFKGKVKSLSLIWLSTFYPGIRSANYTTFKNGSVIVSDGTYNNVPLSEYKHFMTPRLSEEDSKAIIELGIKEDIQGIKPSSVIPLIQKQQQHSLTSPETNVSQTQQQVKLIQTQQEQRAQATETQKTTEEQIKPKQEQTETASNQTLSKEAQKHINRCQVYKKQVEELSKSFKKSEIQTLSTSIANRVSSIISEIEENPNLIKDYFNLERSELSETPTREEIINKIGIDNLYKAIANKYFGNVKSFSKRGKAIKIQRNFQILMLLSNPILSKNEGIQVDFNFTKKDVEQILDSFDENDEANENSATSQESWQNNIRTVSVENMMLPKIRRLLSNLPLIKNGEQIKDEWGIPQTVSLREAIGTILNAIGGKARDHKQMASLLTQYIEDSKNTWLQPIVDILNDTTGKYETEQSLLYKDFCKNSLKFSVSGKDFISHVIDSKQDYAISRIKQTFGSKLWLLQNKTDNKVNREGLNKLSELATVNKLKTKEGIKQLYEAFGIYLSNIDAERITSLEREESLVSTLKSIVTILQKVNEEFTPFDRNSDSGISSYLHTLLEPYVKITSEGFTSTVVSEGKRYQQFVLPSFLSKFNSIIQNSSEEELVNWMMNTYGNVEWYKLSNTNTEDVQESVADGWRNPILQLLATDPNFRKNFDWTQSLGYREEKLYQFMRTMSPLQCFKMQLNMFNATDGRKGDVIPAWYAVPLMANKPSAEFMKLNRYRGDNYKATILGLLAPMFIKEVYRIKLVRDRKNFIKEHPEKEIQNFDERGDKFCNFEMFNDVSESSKKTIEDFIEGKASVEELSNMFNSEMTKYLDSRVITNSRLFGVQSTTLENFYWNNFLAKMSMEDLFLGDSAFYKNVVDKVKRSLQLHSSGQRPNTSATWNKKPVSDGKHRTIVLSSFDKIKSNIISNLKEVFVKKATQFTGEERNAFEAYANSIIQQYEEVDVTDGQAYTTISGYRKKAIMFGKWSKEAEDVYNRLKNGEFNLSDLKQIFQPLKPFQYSQTNTDLSNNGQIASNVSNTLVPSQYKTAEYLLIMADALLQGNTKNNILKTITDIIEDTHSDDALDGIDTVLFDSSVKEGNNAVIDISTLIKEGKTAGEIKTEINNKILGYKQDANNPYVKVTPFEDYMIQQELPPHFKDHYQSFPTQARYLAITDLLSTFNGDEVLFTIGDKSYTVKELQQEWEKVWKEEVDYGTDKLLKELAITSGNKAERNVRLSKLLINSLLDSSKMNMETFESILVDENGEFQMPIDDPALATTVMPLIFSAVKSRVNKQTAAGGPIVQVSSFGTSKKLNIRFKDKLGKLLPTREVWENSKNKSHESYDDFIKENQAGVAYMEVYASVPSDEIFNAFRDKKGNIDSNAINRVNPGLLEMIGVRIPTEGKLSMWPMKIVGFLPSEAGEAIMLPEEITKITGSDFDSDKQYIIRKALSVVERTAENKKEKVINYILEQNKNYTREFVEKAYDEYMENPENYKDAEDVHWEVENALSKSHIKYAARAIGDHNKRRNHIFDMMMAVLQHESVADQLLTPQGFEQLKDLAAEINGVSDFSELQNDPTNLTDLATYLNYYNLNKEGGQMLGIFASQKIAHAILSMDNYHLLISGLEKTPFKLGGQVYKGLIAIDPQYNKEGTLIGEILGSCVGASADVTKDPVLPYLGINSYNINVFITGVRLGIPLKPLVQLLNHPVLKSLYAKKNNGETKSLKSLVSKELNEQLKKAGFEREGRNSEMFMSKDALETDLTALNAFLTLIYCSETVDALSKKTRLNSTTDSATVGPYFGDFLYKDKVLSNQVPEVYDEEGNFVDANDTFYKNHPMLEALYNAFPIIKKIFKDTSLGSQLNTILEEGLRTTGVEILKNQGLATKFIKFYQSQLLFYLNQSDPNKGISIKKVADGYYDTFAKNFNKIKESYKDNQLIKTIEIETNNNTGETTLLIPNLDDLGREEVNALRAAWEDLAVEAPEVARDLFEWNAVKGGLTFNPNTFVHLAGNNVRSLIPGYKEAFAGNADFNISRIYDDFIVKYWRQLMLPRLTPKIIAEKSYKYVTDGEYLYKLNDSGEYREVNTNIPVYQQLSELMDENKSESQEGMDYQDDVYQQEDTEISDNAIAIDALDSSIREERSNYQKYNKDVKDHIEMTEEEKENLNDELDEYC